MGAIAGIAGSIMNGVAGIVQAGQPSKVAKQQAEAQKNQSDNALIASLLNGGNQGGGFGGGGGILG